MKNLVVVGNGSLAAEVSDFVERYHLYNILCFTVDRKYLVPEYLGKPVYPLEELEQYVNKEEVDVFIAIHWLYNLNRFKKQKFDELKQRGFHFANLISPKASVRTSKIGEGNWIDDMASIEFNGIIGDNNTFRTCSLFSHNSTIGSHNVLSGCASIAGGCKIGDSNYFGINSVVFNSLVIGNKNVIGGGSVLKQDIGDFNIVAAPSSNCKQANEKMVEFCISVKGTQFSKLSNSIEE